MILTPNIATTRHFEDRATERRLPDGVLDFIISYGAEVRAGRVSHLTVIERDLPDAIRPCALARRARDWIVLINDAGRLLTCYWRRNALRFLRRKTKRRSSRTE